MVVEIADPYYELMVNWRRALHRHPELSGKEYQTQQLIMDVLENAGIPCSKCADTGVAAFIKGALPGRIVALRADIDALPITEENELPYCSLNPGVMHACGHDAHTAIALGYALYYWQHRQQLAGGVKVFFQPAEETVGGAERMIQEGVLDNPFVDYCIGLHVTPDLPAGTVRLCPGAMHASADSFVMQFIGHGAHGAYPEKGNDAVVMACHAVTMIQSIVSRCISPLESGVITIGKIEGGVKNNIIAPKAQIYCTIRATSPAVRKILGEKFMAACEGAATLMGGHVVLIEQESAYPVLINDRDVLAAIQSAAGKVVGKKGITVKENPSMGADDFSFFTQVLKSAYYEIGCRVGEGRYGLHTPDFLLDEQCLLTGLQINVLATEKLLATGGEN